MRKRHVVISHRIAELGRDPLGGPAPSEDAPGADSGSEAVIQAVWLAVAELDAEEREFVRQHFYEGRSLAEIAGAWGLPTHRAEGMLRRVRRRLHRRLSAVVESRFGLIVAPVRPCLLCQHAQRAEIDRLLEAKRPDQTWRRILAALKAHYGLRITAPGLLIGHLNYHAAPDHERAPDGLSVVAAAEKEAR